jgi:hypothetical protein
MARVVLVVVVFAILAASSAVIFQVSMEEGADRVEIEGESWSPNAGSVTTLDHSNRDDAFYENETIVRDSNGNEVDRGTDYEWYDINGTVKAVSGGALDGESSATIDYQFANTTAEQRAYNNMLSNVPTLLGLALPFLVLILFGRFLA